ncbi:MAG: DUF1611 domain-containing protein [Candidatus Brocadiia bacterium]
MLEGRRVLLLTDGRLGVFTSKTATTILRYRPHDVVALLDRTHAGQDPADIVGVGAGIPIVASVAEAQRYQPRCLLVGIAPPGGGLPDDWRAFLRDAIRQGLDVISGLHLMLGEDPELGPLAAERGVSIHDVRRPPPDIPLGADAARGVAARRILVVGTDCNVGKMAAALEVDAELRRRGRRSRFIATGQTGIMLAGEGIAVDRVVADFVPGAVERMLLAHSHEEALVIEGQGSLIEPAYSGVTLGLMHGSAPDAMVLCHQPGRERLLHHPRVAIPPLAEMIELHERVMAPLHPSRVVGIALNCVHLGEAEARRAVERAEAATGLPATDAVRFGAARLADAVEALL